MIAQHQPHPNRPPRRAHRRRGPRRVAAALGAAALGAAGLAWSAGPAMATGVPDEPTGVPDEEVSLDLAFVDGPDLVDALIAAFTEENPQVEIDAEFTTFADYVNQITLTMTSDSAPDIAQFNPGAMRDLIAEDELLALDDYAEAYDWESVFPPVSLEQLTVDEEGRVFGTGQLLAVPVGLSLTGLFVNEAVAAELGIEAPPATLAELEEQLELASEAGVVPLTVGALDSAGIHLWAALVNVMMPPEQYRDWVNGVPGATIVTDETLAATEQFAAWAEAGYYNESANGIGQADATAQFAAGDSLFLINGNWAAAQLHEAMGDDVGFVRFPGPEADSPARGSGFSVSYSISARSESPDTAAAFLDFLGSEAAAPIIAEGGFLPPNIDAAPDLGGVLTDLNEQFRAVVADDGINAFPDFAAPAMLDALVSGIQSLIAGRMDPAAFLEDLQEIRDEFHGEG